jgi:hypothetical protein
VLAVDEAVGIAGGFRDDEGEPRRPFTVEQRSCVFSAGKPLVAVAVALLEQLGAIDVAIGRIRCMLGRCRGSNGFDAGWRHWPFRA